MKEYDPRHSLWLNIYVAQTRLRTASKNLTDALVAMDDARRRCTTGESKTDAKEWADVLRAYTQSTAAQDDMRVALSKMEQARENDT
jgi:ribonuclease PH